MARKPDLQPMLSVEKVSELLDVSTKTVRRMIAAGDLRSHQVGRQIRVSEDDYLQFIAARRQ